MVNVRVVEPEKCRICGCTELSPCVMEEFLDGGADGFPEPDRWTCTWMDFDHTLCSNVQCVAQIPMNELLEMPLFRIALMKERAA